MAFEVSPDYVRSQILPTLIGHNGRYAGHVNPESLAAYVLEAKRETEQALSTRFDVTRMAGWLGPGVKPLNTAATAQAEAVEYEGPYQWPNMMPGEGYLTWKLNVRPVQEVVSGSFRIPGSFAPGIEIKPEWMRVDSLAGDITLMPQYGAAALVLPNLPFGLFNWMSQRISESMLWTYRAGMTASDWDRFPQINRLVGLLAAVRYLPVLSLKINPTGVTSESADGLSISRSKGYVFADIEERLKGEAVAIRNQVLDAWDGNSALRVL